jgi:nitrogen-specific signal transduction histidine kinase
MELPSPELTEYTEVIVHEADRLQALVDRCSRRTAVRTWSAT